MRKIIGSHAAKLALGMRTRLGVTLALTIAAIGWAVLQSGIEPACAQGHSCAPGSTTRTTICHVPPGNPQSAETRCVANSAVNAHLTEHPGDHVGECPGSAATSWCSPVTVTVIHGQGFLGNSRLARIENGSVPCVHSETGELASCAFNANSGSWVEAVDGNYARMGQAISLTGQPGGEYAVAARVSDEGTVPCVAPSGHDSEGVATEMELAAGCIIETPLSALNASALLVNYANLEVCTTSYPHPDRHIFEYDGTELPVLTRTIAGDGGPTIYCYEGEGAALNDPHGAERGPDGRYLQSFNYCHVVMFSGFETYGAKRPSTYLGQTTNSAIVWRPVNNMVAIANE